MANLKIKNMFGSAEQNTMLLYLYAYFKDILDNYKNILVEKKNLNNKMLKMNPINERVKSN